MRVRILLGFLFGLMTGFAAVALLTYYGALHLPGPSAHAAAIAPAPAEPGTTALLPTPSPTGNVAPAAPTGALPPIVAEIPPPPPPPVPTGSTGTADRTAPGPQPPHLALPLDGIDPNTLHDTFADKRDGHEHEALDIEAPRGTPVHAVAEGNVMKLFRSKDGGLTVYQFDNSQNWCFYYAHLDHYAPGLKEGTLLHQGQVLGYVGSTGNASPKDPHLHFAVNQLKPDKKWWHGTPIDPLPLFR